jgi:hypothetical protein
MASLIASLPKKPKVFVSYHHRNDQRWYDRFSTLFQDKYDLILDTSIQRKIDSFDPDYQSRKIREDHITGSSITVVLLGRETWKRRHVDWEIHATLEKEHALLGIVLPEHSKDWTGQNFLVPDRFGDNVHSGFAHWIMWSENPSAVETAIDLAKIKAVNTKLIQNWREQLAYDVK